MDKKKKSYQKPSYEVEEIYEKMSLACRNGSAATCKRTAGSGNCSKFGFALLS